MIDARTAYGMMPKHQIEPFYEKEKDEFFDKIERMVIEAAGEDKNKIYIIVTNSAQLVFLHELRCDYHYKVEYTGRENYNLLTEKVQYEFAISWE